MVAVPAAALADSDSGSTRRRQGVPTLLAFVNGKTLTLYDRGKPRWSARLPNRGQPDTVLLANHRVYVVAEDEISFPACGD